MFHLKVLISWNEKKKQTTEDLIERVKKWRKKRYVVKEVWNKMQDLVDFQPPDDDEDDDDDGDEAVTQEPKRVLSSESEQTLQLKKFYTVQWLTLCFCFDFWFFLRSVSLKY